jgi:hypothetical protein
VIFRGKSSSSHQKTPYFLVRGAKIGFSKNIASCLWQWRSSRNPEGIVAEFVPASFIPAPF